MPRRVKMAGDKLFFKTAGGPAAEFASSIAHRSSGGFAGDDYLALLKPAATQFIGGAAFGAGRAVAAIALRNGARRATRHRTCVSRFARDPGFTQRHSRPDSGQACGSVEAGGNALSSHHR